MRLKGKTALVTGADSGIGQAIALTFAREGADVAIHYGTDRQGADNTAAQVRQFDRRAEILQADLDDANNAQRLFQQALERLGQIDILVNNAGTSSENDAALNAPLDDVMRVLTIDLISPFALFLASDEASYVTGSSYYVDGGLMVAGS